MSGPSIDDLLAQYLKSGIKLDPLIVEFLHAKNLISEDDKKYATRFWNDKKPLPYVIKTKFQKTSDGRSSNGKGESSVIAIQIVNENLKKKRRTSKIVEAV